MNYKIIYKKNKKNNSNVIVKLLKTSILRLVRENIQHKFIVAYIKYNKVIVIHF